MVAPSALVGRPRLLCQVAAALPLDDIAGFALSSPLAFHACTLVQEYDSRTEDSILGQRFSFDDLAHLCAAFPALSRASIPCLPSTHSRAVLPERLSSAPFSIRVQNVLTASWHSAVALAATGASVQIDRLSLHVFNTARCLHRGQSCDISGRYPMLSASVANLSAFVAANPSLTALPFAPSPDHADHHTLDLDAGLVPGTVKLCAEPTTQTPLNAAIAAGDLPSVRDCAPAWAPFGTAPVGHGRPRQRSVSPLEHAVRARVFPAVQLLVPHSSHDAKTLALQHLLKFDEPLAASHEPREAEDLALAAAAAAALVHSLPTQRVVAAILSLSEVYRGPLGRKVLWPFWMENGLPLIFAVDPRSLFPLSPEGPAWSLLSAHLSARSAAHDAVIRDDSATLTGLPLEQQRRVVGGVSGLMLAIALGRLHCAQALMDACVGLEATAAFPASCTFRSVQLESPTDGHSWRALARRAVAAEESLLDFPIQSRSPVIRALFGRSSISLTLTRDLEQGRINAFGELKARLVELAATD
jgi:hypothetical protein